MSGTVLSAGQAALVLFGSFVALLIARVPVAFALGLACLPILLVEPRLSPMMLAQETFNANNSFILLAVPFILLTANLKNTGGSSTADAASQSKIFIEAQRKEGYDDSFSVAITAVSAVLAVIIPPSILMIVWGGVLTVSLGALFLAGVLPGLLIGLVQMATVHAYAKARGYPT